MNKKNPFVSFDIIKDPPQWTHSCSQNVNDNDNNNNQDINSNLSLFANVERVSFMIAKERYVIFVCTECEHDSDPLAEYGRIIYFDRYLSQWKRTIHKIPNACDFAFTSCTFINSNKCCQAYFFSVIGKDKNVRIDLFENKSIQWSQERILWIFKRIHERVY